MSAFNAIGEEREIDRDEFTPGNEPQPTWCPGCGDFGVLKALKQALPEVGRTPEEVLTSATRTAAACLSMDDVGVLRPGAWADFLVLGEDPLADIRATRSLERVYVAGAQVR